MNKYVHIKKLIWIRDLEMAMLVKKWSAQHKLVGIYSNKKANKACGLKSEIKAMTWFRH